ncbi:ABC-three component system protein [Ralstonia pseudosolanacearum]|uniref:ABC-three component system protein n=1 Tax=Ralstonia pseudosolanacearum TaxID=1310165 RepID=UPI0018D03C68|nr:ABC-three component system protein [Ralstonia pseudosolanacearum]
MAKNQIQKASAVFSALPDPTPWPGANARLLGLGLGLPVSSIDRLAQFGATEFERFTLEWATGYLAKQLNVVEVQQRGGSGDKGRDVIVWLDPVDVKPRRWHLYQCKHYDANLGLPKAGGEIAKVLFYSHEGDYTAPEKYYFVTHKGITSPFQDLLDDPDRLKQEIISNWDTHAKSITTKRVITLTPELKKHIEEFDFSVFRAKQPHELLAEHAKTQFHLTVFGAPLIDRPPPQSPPSTVAATETRYIQQLYSVIGHDMGTPVQAAADFQHSQAHQKIFERSRVTFYCAEGLKELARDHMDPEHFESLLDEFDNGLYYAYTDRASQPLVRMKNTVQAAQALQLGAHPLAPHVTTKDREGMCHQLANENVVDWCNP